MKPCFLRVCPLALLAVFTAAGVSLAKTPPGPPDFGSDFDWQLHDISLVRVVSIQAGADKKPTVVLHTERAYTEQMETTLTKSGYVTRTVRSYADQKDTADRTIPLSAIWFGFDWPAGSPFPRDKPVHVEAGDQLVVWPNHWHGNQPFLPGTKIVGPAAKSPLVQTIEQIAKIRAAGGRAPGLGNTENIDRIAKLRAAGGEAAAKGGASSPDSTVVRYCLSVLETMPPKKADEPFANQLRALRADASRPIVVRLTANRLLPGYAAAPEKARADAAQWPRTIFAASKADSDMDLRSVAKEIMAGFSKREDRVDFFIAIMADETKPRPVRMASVSALADEQCFDFKQPASPVASRVFSAMLFVLNSKDGELRKAGASMPHYVCWRITSPPDQAVRAIEALLALNAAIDVERDEGVLAFMKAYRWHLENILKSPPRPRLSGPPKADPRECGLQGTPAPAAERKGTAGA